MSAPDTNIDKQVRRHRGPLYGMVIVGMFSAIIFALFLGWTSLNGTPPEQDAATETTAGSIEQ